MYQNPTNNNVLGAEAEPAGGDCGAAANNTNAQIMDPIQQLPQRQNPEQQQQQNINYNGIQPQQPQQPQQQQQQQPTNISKNVRKKAYVKIIEQPAGKSLRFRYECEGRSAGSIPGVNSTPEIKTYPTIEIVGFKGRAVVVVSCVTKDPPYRPHPHNLVGKEGCKKGVCTLEINSDTMRAVFSNLGIQCVKKKDIEAALKAREEIRVDPYKTGFTHRFQPSSIDLNSVRLCFQVFMESDQKGRFTQPLAPVVSEPIYDKKAMCDLVICRLCSCSATVLGNTQIILLCEKVAKDDISVRFYEENNGQTIWEAFGEFQHTDVHKQTAIAFKTPRYRKTDITEPAKVFIQLKRPSDGVTSEALQFEYLPLDSGRKRFLDLRRNLKRKTDLDIFQEILSTEIKEQACNEEPEVINLDTPAVEDSPDPQPLQTKDETILTSTKDTTNTDDDEAKRRSQEEIDLIIDEKMRELEQQQNEETSQDQKASLQEVVEVLNAGQQNQNDQEDQLLTMNTNEKINEWMNSNRLLELKNPTFNESIETNSSTTTVNTQVAANDSDDKALNDLLEQVAELDGIYSNRVVRRDTYNSILINELNGIDSCVPATDGNLVDGGQTAMEVEESFDDAATYSSLQIAFKNPISIPMCEIMMPLTPPASNLETDFDNGHYDPIDVQLSGFPTTSAPVNSTSKPEIISQSQPQLQAPPRPAPPQSNSPHMHVTAAEEEKLPPLPPKRLRKQDSNAENRSIEANIGGGTLDRNSRQQAPIIIMKTPDQSPPNKRLPQKPGSSSTLPKQKKPGFFSKLFSRRKSKSDLSQAGDKTASSKSATPTVSRAPSIGHFNTNDSNRASMRSVKSLQPISLPNSPEKKIQKTGKPVGRSVSSVSDPAHLKRKRQRFNGDPIHLLLQQQRNQHQNDHQDGRQTNINCWNGTNILPEIKTEPRDVSPQAYGVYRVPPNLTPSPQPLSPPNVYTHNIPSPYNMSTTIPAGAQGNQQVVVPNQHYNNNNNNAVGGSNASPLDYNGFGQQPQQYHDTNFGGAGATQWDIKYDPATAGGNNMGNLNNATTFAVNNIPTAANGAGGPNNGASVTSWNVTSNHFHPNPNHHHNQMQPQYQQHQTQNDNNNRVANTAVPVTNTNNATTGNNGVNNEHGLSNLLTFDSEQLVRINSEDQDMLQLNSEDLQISNLSIST